ncbi:MAG TPA: NmrA family transcriptional regulator [Actinokineospora sp.]|nr:NmrA family transcriptional regulator [Actinokineospora sp.]
MGDTQADSNTILVIGGTGKTGRRVAERLAERGLPVRVGSRAGSPPFDWADQDTFAAAVDGVRSAYVSYHPDLAFPGAVESIRMLCKTAVASGVERLVLLSGRGEEEAEECEHVVRDCGAQWTILRSAWFAQNFSENFLLEAVLAGEIALPAGDMVEPFLDIEDLAEIAVDALLGDDHVGVVYDLTGPRLLSFAEAAAEIAKATGRDIAYVPVSHEQYAAALRERGLPEALADLLRKVLDGRNAHLSDGVRRALGRPAKDFSDYVTDTAATGVWTVN